MSSVPGDMEIPLSEHLKELRSRMLIAVVPIIVLTAVAFLYSGELLRLIMEQIIPENASLKIIMNIYSPMELLITKLIISLICALFLGIPLIIYESFMFIGKGLYENEKMFFLKIVPFSFILFTAGAAVAYFLVVPILFKYTIFYSTGVADPQISVMKAINTLLTLILGFGFIFQFPLLMIFAVKMGLLNPEFLKNKRKIVYGVLVAFALFVSPDPSGLVELMVALMLVVLFEFSLLLARYL